MNDMQVLDVLKRELQNIAPEADLSLLKPDRRIRDQLDLDSMDFLNFVIGLHTALQIDIPERDYSKLASLDGCKSYLAAALATKNVVE